jgi:hypothetical protein
VSILFTPALPHSGAERDPILVEGAPTQKSQTKKTKKVKVR